MKKRIIGVLTAALMGLGLSLVAISPASAHTPFASATCETLTVNATNYETKPSSGEETIPNPDYVPAVPEVPEIPEVSHTEYQFVHKFDFLHLFPKWSSDPNWNANGNPNSVGWISTGQTRVVIDQEYVPGIPGVPAVGEPTIPNPDYVPADSAPNTVVVEINGVVVANDTFGNAYGNTFSFDNKYVANEWSVTFTAWNDPTGAKGWTKTISGTTTPCEIPVVGPNHGASIAAECGSATITLTNDEAEYEDNLTASFVVWVDGEFYGAYAVIGGGSEQVNLSFPEDSGDHTVVVEAGPAQGGEKLAEATVTTDCIPAQPEDKVTYGDWEDGKWECDDTTVATSRTVTTTPYVLVEGQWVLDEENAVTVTEEGERTLNEDEVFDCPTPPSLALTGSSPASAGLIGASVLLVGGFAMFAIVAIRRRRERQA